MSIRQDVDNYLPGTDADPAERIHALERIVKRLAGELERIEEDLEWHGVVEQSHRPR